MVDKPYISNKNHKHGCRTCENCGSSDLKKTSIPEMQLTEWKCKLCDAEHYWKYDMNREFFDQN